MNTILRTLIVNCSLFTISFAVAQDMTVLLPQIEQNNKTLKALRQEVQAEKEANHIGLAPDNPEVEFHYLWGSATSMGNRTDITVSQSLPLSKVFGYQLRLAKQQDLRADLRLKVERTNILLEAEQKCIEIVYCNVLLREYRKRLDHAEALAQAYEEKFAAGNTNAIEYNKIRLNLATAMGDYRRIEAERSTLVEQLAALNGGEPIALADTVFTLPLPPADFDSWYQEAEQRSPMLQYVRQESEVAQADVRLSRAEWLPELRLGYMTEGMTGEYYQGLTVGLTVPLWQNTHRVRQAKAAQEAASLRLEEQRQQFLSTLRAQYAEVSGLQKTWQGYVDALRMTNSADLLLEALQAGQISMLDYMQELSLYYDATSAALAAQRDYLQALTQLQAVAL